MIHGPKFWILVGSFAVLFLFIGECLNAYSTNNPKQTALSQAFHSFIGLIGTGILASIFGVGIFVFFLIVFFGLVILIIYLVVTAIEMVGLGIVIFTVIGFTGYTLETIALTLAGPGLDITVVKNRVWVGLTDLIRTLSTCFAPLLVFIPWHQQNTTTPESPFGFSFGTGKQFHFGFRANPQKKFLPNWKPHPYWGDGLEGDFGVCPFSQKLLNPIFERSTGQLSTGIHNQMKPKAEEEGKIFGIEMEFDFTFRPDSQNELEPILVQYRRISRQ